MISSCPLRVGFDARALSHPQPGGYKSYSASLLAALASLGADLELTAYLDRPWTPSRELQTDGVRFEVVPATPAGVGMPLREQWRLPRRVSKERPDLVHFPCATAPLWCRGPVVVTIHDTIEYQPQYYATSSQKERIRRRIMHMYNRLVTRRVAERAEAVITDSEHSRDDLVRVLRLDPDRIHVVPISHHPRFRRLGGPELASEMARLTRDMLGGVPLAERFVLALVSPSPRKNAGGLVEAYARLPKALRDEVSLVLVWSHGVWGEAVDVLVRGNDLTDQVRSLHGVTDEDLVVLYNAAAAFVFPSLYEGFGLPVLEAMACGTPVIASSLTSVPEVTADAALLVDPRDTEALAKALGGVLSMPELAQRLAAAGMVRADGFKWRRTAELTFEVYSRVAGRS